MVWKKEVEEDWCDYIIDVQDESIQTNFKDHKFKNVSEQDRWLRSLK